MAIIGEIANFGASAVGGGIFGLAGTLLGRVAGYFERKQEQAFAIKKWAHESEQKREDYKHEVTLHDLNRKAASEEFERDIVLNAQQGSFKGLEASTAAQAVLNSNPNGSHKIIDVLRMVRPTITFLLILLSAVIFFFSPPETKIMIAHGIIFLTVSTVLWWFGDRAPAWLAKGLQHAKIN